MSPMQPGSPQAMMPAREDALIRKIQEIERTMREFLPSVAISFGPVVADLRAKDVILAAQQADLAAKDAQILDLISKVVEVADFDHTETGFDPGTGSGGWPTVSSVTLTVPAGFTQAVVTAVAYAAIRNTTPSTGTLIHCRALVNGDGGPVDDETSNPGVRSTVLAAFPTRVTGLTGGGTFVVACQAYAGADFAADADNTATISGTVLWLR